MKNFFRMIKLEFIRIIRNKFILTMLAIFSIVMLCIVSFVNPESQTIPIGVYCTDSTQNIEMFEDIFKDIKNGEVIQVNSIQEGKDLIIKTDICMLIEIDTTTSPTTAKIYYDHSSNISSSIKDKIEEASNEYAYTTLKQIIYEKFGITLNEKYFEQVSFEKIRSNNITPTQKDLMYISSCLISVILLFGLTYSISRDNETNVSNNLKYMPINEHKYLWSKIIPYLIIGLFESIFILILFYFVFKLSFIGNVFILLLFFLLYSLSTITQGLLCCLLKNQVSSIFVNIFTILLPLFVLSLSFPGGLPIPIQIICYIMPMFSFVQLSNSYIFNGYILWHQVLILVLLSLVYYFLTAYLTKRKINK